MPAKKQELVDGFSKRLRERREAAGLRQADVAALVGLSEEPYARLERGLALPRVETLVALAHAFNVTSDSLLGLGAVSTVTTVSESLVEEAEAGDEGSETVESVVEPVMESPDFRRLLRSARKLDARSLNLVAQLSESLGSARQAQQETK